ncbi:MFS monosaccharide transporter-like protein [Pyrenochaeta sp. DS3sAY3a]|nr:MFS monosaccharide transporter-like protein [Pyrenochaeta sp. DS3sAY3a]
MTTPSVQTPVVRWHCFAACALVSICPFQYGLDQGVIGGLQAMPGFLQVFGHADPASPFGYNLSYTRQQLLASLMVIGVFLSSASAGLIADRIGRKPSLWSGAMICAISNSIMMASTNIGAVYFARFLLGVSNGLFITFGLLYLQECAPPEYRGMAIGISQVWQSIGSLVGVVVNNATFKLQGKLSYIIPLGTIFLVPLILTIFLFFIPESPRWYVQQNETDKARVALAWFLPQDDSIEEELNNIKVAVESGRALSAGTSFLDMFRQTVDRRRTFLVIGALTIQAAVGIIFIVSYSTYFFAMAQTGSPFENTCILLGVASASALVNSAAIRKYGRRRVFLVTGTIICGISQLICAAVYDKKGPSTSTGKVIIGFTILYIAAYNGMISTYSWVVAGELPSQRLRSYTFGLASAISFFFAWLTTFTAPYFINPDSLNWGPKYGYIWAPSCFVAALWVYFYLPETQNRTLEEISEMFEKRLPQREFRSHNCSGLPILLSDHQIGKEQVEKDSAVHTEAV